MDALCQLSRDPCQSLEADDTTQVIRLRDAPRGNCLTWVLKFEIGSIIPVSSLTCRRYAPKECYIGRLVWNDDILPGNYVVEVTQVQSVLDDQIAVAEGTEEVLSVNPSCPLLWLPFHAGDTLPLGAQAGGFLDSTGSILYVMRAYGDQYLNFGYYDPDAQQGLIPYGAKRTPTDMELLISLWTHTGH